MIAQPGIAEQAKVIYQDRLRGILENEHRDEFVAIELGSGDYFLGKSFVEAALAAKKSHPDHEVFVIRIGHEAAFHLGAAS
jgi:hypothetical protein